MARPFDWHLDVRDALRTAGLYDEASKFEDTSLCYDSYEALRDPRVLLIARIATQNTRYFFLPNELLP